MNWKAANTEVLCYFHNVCKVSLLQNIGVLSIFHDEKPTVLLSVLNVNEQRKEMKNTARTKTRK
jgi:hypothetical protein